MKKSVFWIVVIILVLIALGLGFSTFKGCTGQKAAVSKNDTLSSDLSAANSEISLLYDSISTLNTMLDDCPKWKYRNSKRTTVKRQKTQQQTTQTTQSTSVTEQTQRVTVPGDNPSRTENTGLCGDEYMGVYNGSHGVTINEESKLVYFISNEELNAGEGKLMLSAPQLNGANSGNEFYWDASKKLWIFETNELITIARLLDVDHKYGPIGWCVYIGQQTQWNYPMFLPHEIVKTGSSSARSALSNGEVRLHDPADINQGADYISKIQFKKK